MTVSVGGLIAVHVELVTIKLIIAPGQLSTIAHTCIDTCAKLIRDFKSQACFDESNQDLRYDINQITRS